MDVKYSVLRLGRINPAKIHTQDIIIQSLKRPFHVAIWKMTKNSDNLKQRNLSFKEDLTPEDAKKLNRLWPIIQEACKEKKIAYFMGGRAVVDNKQIQ